MRSAGGLTPQKRSQLQGSRPGKLQLILIILFLLLLGGFFSLVITSDLLEVDSNAHAINTFSKAGGNLLSKRILDWMPSDVAKSHATPNIADVIEPDWSVEFWSPIDVELESPDDPLITMCKLNFKDYSKKPHEYPMFKDLESLSLCQGRNRRKEKLSKLMRELEAKKGTPAGRIVPPTGFVFHESRVGSTLVANTLASDPFSMVFSESPPPAAVLLHCHHDSGCDRNLQVKLFRDVVTLMGNSPIHKRLFFKLQSITSTKMEIALEAFPDTPFAFVYRNSVQTMMSHLDPNKGSYNAPCMRSKRTPPEAVSKALEGLKGGKPDEAWCAAHLNMLCQSALNAYHKYSVTHDDAGHIKQRGLLINYESLPGIVPRALLPLFNVEPGEAWLQKMDSESKVYSKGHGNTHTFVSDSQDKEQRASEKINHYASVILDASYNSLLDLGLTSLHAVSPESYHLLEAAAGGTITDPHKVEWKLLKKIPEHSTLPHVQRLASELELQQQQKEKTAIADAKYAKAKASLQSVQNKEEKQSQTEDTSTNIKLNLRGPNSHLAAHGHPLAVKEFIPWSPFSNTHSSSSVSPAECGPLTPNSNYPHEFSAIDILKNWNPDNTEIPARHYDTLCHFDYQDKEQYKLAIQYRDAEVPFVVYNVPEIDAVVKKWGDLDYLQKRLGNRKYRTEKSENNHFMYWNSNRKTARSEKETHWKEPTEIISNTFENFIEIAIKGQNTSLEQREHQYFRVSSDTSGNDWLTEELPFFKAKKSLFVKEPDGIRGIHCRFGMRSVTAEAHFDGSRNFAVQLGGMRRWILVHPRECENLYLLPANHPSGRHTEIDLSGPIESNLEKFPRFAKLLANEVIMQPGDALFIPTHWFHHIISLNLNYQCNCRSGNDYMPYLSDIAKCGF